MVTVAEGIAALRALENVVSVRFESIENYPDVVTSQEGEPPTSVITINQYSLVTVRMISIKGSEAKNELVEAICYDFGGPNEAVYLIVEKNGVNENMGMIGMYRHKEKATGGNGTTTTFVSQKVPRNQIVEVSYASVVDYTTKNKLLVLGIRDASANDTYLKVTQESSTFSIALEGPILLYEGDSIIGLVLATTTSDACYFSVHGKRYELLPKK